MADTNRVLFGFSQVHVGTYTVDPTTGEVTLGAPYHQKGAVGFSPENQGESVDFFADNYDYFSDETVGPRSGDLVVAKFDRDFLTSFCGHRRTAGGGIGEVINPVRPSIYMAFQVEGDAHGMRVIMYNGTVGTVNREFATMEGSRTPATEALPLKFIGDQASGLIVDRYYPGDEGYDTLFTNPPLPELASE